MVKELIMKIKNIFITGLSSAGKTTLGEKIINELQSMNINCILVDGTELYDFSILYPFEGHAIEDRANRSKHLMRLLSWLNSKNIVAIVPIIGQPLEIRNDWEKFLKSHVEIFIDCDIETCIKRDNKDLYEKYKKGELNSMVGLDIEFKKPKNAWLEMDGNLLSKEDVFEKAMFKIKKELI
jgi:adenylylsulfate kinase-like enzyme